MAPSDQSEPDNELTPEARMIIGKARRSFGFSISILLIGFIAIAFALVYRATRDDGGPAGRYGVETIMMPIAAEILSIDLEAGMLGVTVRSGETVTLYMVDGKTGEILKTIPVATE